MPQSVSLLYKMARVANDVETLLSSNPKRIAGREKACKKGLQVSILIRRDKDEIKVFKLFYGHCWHW